MTQHNRQGHPPAAHTAHAEHALARETFWGQVRCWRTVWRHLWAHERAAWRAVPDDMAQRLAQRVQASEQRHTGQVCVCIEGALPLALAWRAGRSAAGAQVAQVARARAMTWFGRMRVWDTEHNNGVLIYLLLAERRIEIVADRGVVRHTQAQPWAQVVQTLGVHLQAGDVEGGLAQALQEVSAWLVAHCPAPDAPTPPSACAARNELPDAVWRV